VLAVLALAAAQTKGAIDAQALAAHMNDLRKVPDLMRKTLKMDSEIAALANTLAPAPSVLFLGRGVMFATALEAALKLKELSYIHAEAYASGELKHGPIALIEPALPVVVFAPHDRLFDKTLSNMQEVMARHGQVMLITDAQGRASASDSTHSLLELPATGDLSGPIVYALPAQLLAYHTAMAKGTDIDQPRNLAKSVTVE
jgi:glucosamine--fructose-6-phosphate aminotransferase (isomerizing)